MKKLLFFASTLLLLLNACRKEEVLEVLDVPANWDRTYTAPTNCANVVNNEKYFVIFRTGKLAYPQMHAIWMQANLQPAKNSNGQMLFGASTTVNQYCTDSNKVPLITLLLITSQAILPITWWPLLVPTQAAHRPGGLQRFKLNSTTFKPKAPSNRKALFCLH